MSRNTIVQSLLVASLASLAASAGAQYVTPPPTVTPAPTVVTPAPTVVTPAPTPDAQPSTQYNTILPMAPQQGIDDQMKAYQDARRACDGQPLTQQSAC